MRVLSRLCTCLPWCKPSSLSPRTTVATLSSGSGDAEPLERAAALLSSGAKVVVIDDGRSFAKHLSRLGTNARLQFEDRLGFSAAHNLPTF